MLISLDSLKYVEVDHISIRSLEGVDIDACRQEAALMALEYGCEIHLEHEGDRYVAHHVYVWDSVKKVKKP
jgi:hypothetical protein